MLAIIRLIVRFWMVLVGAGGIYVGAMLPRWMDPNLGSDLRHAGWGLAATILVSGILVLVMGVVAGTKDTKNVP